MMSTRARLATLVGFLRRYLTLSALRVVNWLACQLPNWSLFVRLRGLLFGRQQAFLRSELRGRSTS